MSDGTYLSPAHGWTCFHCGETFHTVEAGRLHFGGDIDSLPGCMIRVKERGLLGELRRVEEENRKLVEQLHADLAAQNFHKELAAALKCYPTFKTCSTLRDVFHLFDSMQGRTIAAEYYATKLRGQLQAKRDRTRQIHNMKNELRRVRRSLLARIEQTENLGRLLNHYRGKRK